MLAFLDLLFVLISTSKKLVSSRIKLVRRDDNSLLLALSTAPGLWKEFILANETYIPPGQCDSRNFSTKAHSMLSVTQTKCLSRTPQKGNFAGLVLSNNIYLRTQNFQKVLIYYYHIWNQGIIMWKNKDQISSINYRTPYMFLWFKIPSLVWEKPT